MQRSTNPLIISPGAESDAAELSLFFGTVKDQDGRDVIDQDRIEFFLEQLLQTYNEVRDFPESNGFYEDHFRRRLFLREKYMAIYRAFEDATVVYCVAHGSMEPEKIRGKFESREA